jgi:carboxymethylenebutenolidase
MRFSKALPLVLLTTLGTAPLKAQDLPADGDGAVARLDSSPRHGEWVRFDAGGGDMVEGWVVYPERSDAAPVIVVIHEIGGLSDWIRAVADQLAAAGYIAIAPDMLSGKGPEGGGTRAFDPQEVRVAIRDLDRSEVNRRLRAAGAFGASLPAALDRVGVVGFCWGGSASFTLATDWPELSAAVVYYGTTPETGFEKVQAPVLGLYGGDDARVNATIPRAEEGMSLHDRGYEPNLYEGAGHGFLRQQSGRDGANMRATQQAWARTLSWFGEWLGR